MKKGTILILAYAIAIAGLIASIKIAERAGGSGANQHTLIADCGDGTVKDQGSE